MLLLAWRGQALPPKSGVGALVKRASRVDRRALRVATGRAGVRRRQQLFSASGVQGVFVATRQPNFGCEAIKRSYKKGRQNRARGAATASCTCTF